MYIKIVLTKEDLALSCIHKPIDKIRIEDFRGNIMQKCWEAHSVVYVDDNQIKILKDRQ